jgi:anaerobic magnesium-protoporphyrin IX monomethyl ester cyclase
MIEDRNRLRKLKILLTQPLFDSSYLYGCFKVSAGTNTFLFGQASLAAVAREAGHDVLILDPFYERTTPDQYIRYLKDHKFDVVGCTVFTLTFNPAKTLFEYTRCALPKACLLAGGPHPTSLPRETLERIKELDAVVIGEGEITFLEILERIAQGKEFISVHGAAYRRREDSQIVINPPREFISNLDELPRPAYDLFPIEKYIPTPNLVKRYPTVAIQVTRGCPHRCGFCQFNLALGKKYRHRSLENIIEELDYLKSRYHVRGIIFRDSSLTIDIKFLKDLCHALIRGRLDLKWMCYSRTDVIARHYKEVLPLMRQAGCWQIGYGCESANQRSLDILNKDITVEDNITAVTETMKAGIMCSTTWIICIPGESGEDAWRTIMMAKKLASHVTKFFLPVPFPNTEFEKICREDGGLRENISFDHYNLLLPKSLVYVNPLIGEESMLKMLRTAYMRYYTDHKVLLRNLASITNWDMVKKYWAFLRLVV